VPPSTSLIVVSFQTRDATLSCVEALLEACAPDDEVIVVDNASTDDTAAALRKAFPAVRVLRQVENLGFARAANIGARAGSGSRLFFVNSDCIVRPDSLGLLESFLDDHPDAAVAVPRLLLADGGVQCTRAGSVRSGGT
jgi:N-acetylglucosaminyl-diphospho-decaprenol L-rhamnosyltransferase